MYPSPEWISEGEMQHFHVVRLDGGGKTFLNVWAFSELAAFNCAATRALNHSSLEPNFMAVWTSGLPQYTAISQKLAVS
jgi:hypothetical protein